MGQHPCMRRGSLLKVEGVLRQAKADGQFRKDLVADPSRLSDSLGIVLTNDEKAALSDVVHGTSNSIFAEPPADAPFDKMAALRQLWGD